MAPVKTTRSMPMSLLRAREAVMSQFRPMLAKYDVTEQQWRVIRTLGETSPLEATELADRTSILAPSLTRIIKALVDRKLIARTKSMGDGRRVELSITPGGQRLIDKVSPEANAIYAALKKRMGAKRYEETLDTLEGIAALGRRNGRIIADSPE